MLEFESFFSFFFFLKKENLNFLIIFIFFNLGNYALVTIYVSLKLVVKSG